MTFHRSSPRRGGAAAAVLRFVLLLLAGRRGEHCRHRTGVIVVHASSLSSSSSDDCAALYNYDCYGCILSGCYWCPGDALCSAFPGGVSSSDLDRGGDNGAETGFALMETLDSSCPTAGDYVTATCGGGASAKNGTTEAAAGGGFFADPNYPAQQWVFDAIKISPVWDGGYLGGGIRVRINDGAITAFSGTVVGAAPELDPSRIDLDESCDQDEDDEDEGADGGCSPNGNAVLSILAATGGNDQCGVGVAPDVSVSTCSPPRDVTGLLASPSLATAFLAHKVDGMDVSQNSWSATIGAATAAAAARAVGLGGTASAGCGGGDPDCEAPTERWMLIDGELPALVAGVEDGRDGKGVVYVFASGDHSVDDDGANDLHGFDSMNAPWHSTRYTLSVGAVGKNGLHAYYSAESAALFVCAPGGNTRESISNMIGVDHNGRCTDVGQGTGLATPVVSAVVALMLEANPNLSWRDVQAIIAATSEPVDDDAADKTADVNSAGLWHSNRYGFGIIRADRAVAAAETWELVGPELSFTLTPGAVEKDIPCNPAEPLLDSIKITDELRELELPFVVETVYLLLKIISPSPIYRLHVELTSPGGVKAEWTPVIRQKTWNSGSDGDAEWIKLTSVRSWGDSPEDGPWSLSTYDPDGGTENGEDSPEPNILVEWRLRIFGHEGPPGCQTVGRYSSAFIECVSTRH